MLAQRKAGRVEEVLDQQLKSGIEWVRGQEWRRLTVAYEPVWAIGTGEVATPPQAEKAHRHIRAWLAARFSEEAGRAIRILYGGSVNKDNVRDLMAIPDVDGVLVGGASLKPETFLPIVEFDRQ
jgi:triosephosphate isomerase